MKTLALDIGGANLKAAHSGGGKWHAWSAAFALWKQPGRLAEKLNDLVCDAPPFELVLLTMTAELCDCFETKRDGVEHVLRAVELAVGGRRVGVWSTAGRFVTPDEARDQPLQCAASNWHALATYVARLFPKGRSLLIDTGSTTTDIIPLESGRLTAQGLTDTDRLITGELVYTGVLRTPLAAMGPAIAWRGQQIGLMAEFFSTFGDVHLLLGDLEEDAQRTDTADGRPRTKAAAAARIVRMIGADLDMLAMDDANELARVFADLQIGQITAAMSRVVGERRPVRVVLSGSGDFLAARAAAVALPEVPTLRLAERLGPAASAAACAYALLHLTGLET